MTRNTRARAFSAYSGERLIRLDQIQRHARNQPRSELDKKLVEEYVANMTIVGKGEDGRVVDHDGKPWPALTVFEEERDDGTLVYHLADGFHRYQAAYTKAIRGFQCVVKKGGRREAWLASLGANATHGKRRTNEDKRRVVAAALTDKELTQYSDSAIAKICQVSSPFVGKLRKELGLERDTVITLRDGEEVEIDVSNRKGPGTAGATLEALTPLRRTSDGERTPIKRLHTDLPSEELEDAASDLITVDIEELAPITFVEKSKTLPKNLDLIVSCAPDAAGPKAWPELQHLAGYHLNRDGRLLVLCSHLTASELSTWVMLRVQFELRTLTYLPDHPERPFLIGLARAGATKFELPGELRGTNWARQVGICLEYDNPVQVGYLHVDEKASMVGALRQAGHVIHAAADYSDHIRISKAI